MNKSLLYHDLAKDLTVGTLCGRLGRDIEATEKADVVLKELDQGLDVWAFPDHLVRENGRLVGICSLVDFLNQITPSGGVEGGIVRDCAQPITPNRMVSINTPFSRAVHLFADDEMPYYVLDADQIAGVLRPGHIYGLRAILCYLALTLDLETAALNLCTWFPEALNSLPERRRSKTLQRYHEKMKKIRQEDWNEALDTADPESRSETRQLFIRDAMQSTDFIDKATMIKRSKLLIDQSNTRIENIFCRAERVRNACAHPFATDPGHPERWPSEASDLFQMTPAETSRFIKDCLDMIDSINAVMPAD